jgi:hypothetical protein
MLNKTRLAGVLVGLTTIALAGHSARAQISATATITAAPSGANWLYTVSLKNTAATASSATNIETFWFAWAPPFYDFLPSLPTVTNQPANWTTYIEHYSGGYSIEWYDPGTTSPISAGQTTNLFQFTSPDSPTTLSNTGQFSLGLPITYSFAYSGPNDSGDSQVFSSILITTVPEPATYVLMSIGGVVGLLIFRGSRARRLVTC